MTLQLEQSDRLREVLDRLIAMSKEDYYNPYEVFKWPDTLPEHQYWMSPELMSIHGTSVAERLTPEQIFAVSKWESINFYSLNVEGIRELIVEIMSRIHTAPFAVSSEYFHHLIGEENDHMWFFARFCLNYGHKIYPDKGIRFDTATEDEASHFLVFARLLIFEEIVDFFNKQMGTDQRLHETIRQINAIHHQDESRHVAFGRQIVSLLHAQLRETLDDHRLAEIEVELKRYIRRSVDSLVNPSVYRDAGLDDPYGIRKEVLASPSFKALEDRMLKRTMSYMVREGIFKDAELASA